MGVLQDLSKSLNHRNFVGLLERERVDGPSRTLESDPMQGIGGLKGEKYELGIFVAEENT